VTAQVRDAERAEAAKNAKSTKAEGEANYLAEVTQTDRAQEHAVFSAHQSAVSFHGGLFNTHVCSVGGQASKIAIEHLAQEAEFMKKHDDEDGLKNLKARNHGAAEHMKRARECFERVSVERGTQPLNLTQLYRYTFGTVFTLLCISGGL
jgi:hypothetical protein